MSSNIPEILERCAGIDIHKKTAVVCIMVGFAKKMKREIRTFGTMTDELRDVAKWLKDNKIQDCVIESTGPYWLPVFNVLDGEFEINVILANPNQVKNVPNRKSDVKDAEIIGNVFGATGFKVIRLIAAGERDSNVLAKCFTRKIKASKESIKKALTGTLDDEDKILISFLVRHIDEQMSIIKDLESKIDDLSTKFKKAVTLLQDIPGISDTTAKTIIAEAGVDMNAFPSSQQFASWTGLVPRTDESAGKRRNTSISGGNRYIRNALVGAAWSAVITKNSYWRAEFQRLRPRLGSKKAIVAIARKLAECVYSILRTKKNIENLELMRLTID